MTLTKAENFLIDLGFRKSKGQWINPLTKETAFIYYKGNNKYWPEID